MDLMLLQRVTLTFLREDVSWRPLFTCAPVLVRVTSQNLNDNTKVYSGQEAFHVV